MSLGFCVEATVFLYSEFIGSDDLAIMILYLLDGYLDILSQIPFISYYVTTSLDEIIFM